MIVVSKYLFKFAPSKSYERHEVAASEQRFLCRHLSTKYSRKEWGSSNVPEVSARMNLTAPMRHFCLMSKLYEYE